MKKVEIVQAAKEIKISQKTETIERIAFMSLLNLNLEKIGLCVLFELSEKWEYKEETILGWKKYLDAHDWSISAKSGKLKLIYFVYFK